MTRDEFEKLPDKQRVTRFGDGGTFHRFGAEVQFVWDDGPPTLKMWPYRYPDSWLEAVSIETKLTANEQLLVSELENAVNIIDDLERRLARHERAKRDGGASARAAILKVRGG